MISAKLFQKYASDPVAFRTDLIVDVDGTARKFGEVMDPWQRQDFAAIDPGLMRCNGRKADDSARMRAYLERPRGHSKTTDLAVTCCWALAFATRPIRGYAFAADKDQAGLLKDAMATVCRLNPWLGEILDVQKGLVVNKANGHPGEGGKLEIFTSDVASSYGILPDLIVADELTHWEGDGALWHSIISSAAKRSTCLLCVITNAGFADSWQWSVREAARTDEAWHFSRLEGPQASWMTPARLAEQRRMLPLIAYMRLWENQWSSGGGDALTQEDINAAFLPGIAPMARREPGFLYVGGSDLGLKRDCSAFVILAVPDQGRWGKIRLAHHRLWRPTLGRKINLAEVEAHILEQDQLFGLECVGFDPWQHELLATRIESNSDRRRRNQQRRQWAQPFMREITPSAANLREQATLVIEHFTDRKLELFDCEPLRRDFMKLRCEEKQYGVRLTSPRDGDGHGDSASAFFNALMLAHELSVKRPTKAGAVESIGQPRSAWARACEQFEREQDTYQREQERAQRPTDHNAEWRDAMFRAGRTTDLP